MTTSLLKYCTICSHSARNILSLLFGIIKNIAKYWFVPIKKMLRSDKLARLALGRFRYGASMLSQKAFTFQKPRDYSILPKIMSQKSADRVNKGLDILHKGFVVATATVSIYLFVCICSVAYQLSQRQPSGPTEPHEEIIETRTEGNDGNASKSNTLAS